MTFIDCLVKESEHQKNSRIAIHLIQELPFKLK